MAEAVKNDHNGQEPLLKVEHLKQYFPISRKFTVKAVDDVSFDIYPGETYGLVGESGSGKSTIGRAVIRLYDPTAGKIIFDGRDISGKMNAETTNYLRTNMQMIFQDPMACLNPRKKVVDIIAQGLDVHHMYSSFDEREEKVARILQKVGLAPEHATRFPHQFSGGQRQRIGIARALVMNPQPDYCRRVHFRTGRVYPGAGGQPDEGYSAGNRQRLYVHCPRPVHGQIHFQPDRRAASGPSGGKRYDRGDL